MLAEHRTSVLLSGFSGELARRVLDDARVFNDARRLDRISNRISRLSEMRLRLNSDECWPFLIRRLIRLLSSYRDHSRQLPDEQEGDCANQRETEQEWIYRIIPTYSPI